MTTTLSDLNTDVLYHLVAKTKGWSLFDAVSACRSITQVCKDLRSLLPLSYDDPVWKVLYNEHLPTLTSTPDESHKNHICAVQRFSKNRVIITENIKVEDGRGLFEFLKVDMYLMGGHVQLFYNGEPLFTQLSASSLIRIFWCGKWDKELVGLKSKLTKLERRLRFGIIDPTATLKVQLDPIMSAFASQSYTITYDPCFQYEGATDSDVWVVKRLPRDHTGSDFPVEYKDRKLVVICQDYINEEIVAQYEKRLDEYPNIRPIVLVAECIDNDCRTRVILDGHHKFTAAENKNVLHRIAVISIIPEGKELRKIEYKDSYGPLTLSRMFYSNQ